MEETIFWCKSFNVSKYRYNFGHVNQLDAQLLQCIFRQPLHVSGVSRTIIRRYNRNQPGQQTVI